MTEDSRREGFMGQVIGHRFLVQESLGEGPLWASWLGQDLQSGQPVTVKLMVDEAAADSEATPRFLKQAEDAFRLDHPHIVRTIATGMEAGRHFLVSEHVDGRDLRQWFSDGTHSFAELRDKLKATCEALHYAHSNGVFHRSLRPDCILVDASGRLLVADFGFARRLEGAMRRSSPGAVEDSVTYITPEQARGQRGDARSDLYTLGIVLYEICTGRPPFTDPDATRVVYRHMNERPVPPRQVEPRIPHWLSHVIMKLLEKDPTRRYQTARDLSQELSRLTALGEGQFIELEASDPAKARRQGSETPVVGRDATEKTLNQLLARTLQGRGRVALLPGEAGVGKTRMASELCAQATASGFMALQGRATGRIRPLLGPFLDMVHECTRREGASPAEVLGDGAGLLECFLDGRLDEILTHDSAAGLARFRHSALEFVRRLSAQAPLLLVFDDTHRADQPTLELIRALAGEIAKRRLMIVITWEPDVVVAGSSLATFLTDIEGSAEAKRIPLGPLKAEATRTLLLHLCGAHEASPALVETVHRSTRGLPLAIEELVGQQMREHGLQVVEGCLECPDLEALRTPRGLRPLVERRVAGLPQKASMMLTLAACVGASFDFDVLTRVSGKPQEEVASVMQWAQHNGWLEPEWHPGRERYRFTHSMYVEALYASIESRSRTRLHLLIAMALEETYALRLRDVIEVLANHYAEAGQPDKAVAYALLAADRQWSLHALEDARAWYDRALELLGDSDDPEGRRVYCLKSLSRIFHELGCPEDARRYAEEGLSLATSRQDAVEEREMLALL